MKKINTARTGRFTGTGKAHESLKRHMCNAAIFGGQFWQYRKLRIKRNSDLMIVGQILMDDGSVEGFWIDFFGCLTEGNGNFFRAD